MKLKDDIFNELKTVSTVVASVPYKNVFTVEAGYFEGIEDELKARIEANGFYSSENNFTVPAGYFEGLSANILKKIKAEESEIFTELNEYSTLLASIGNRNVFSAPAGYFENFCFKKEQIPVAKVIKMSRTKAVFKYAAAAVITGLLGLSIINIVNKSGTGVSNETSLQTAAAISSGNDILKTGSFDKELQALSDRDIEQYLQQGGQDVNAALVAASMDDAEKLPEAADYLLDENVLDNYLKENNLKN